MAVQTGLAAVVGVVLAREFGRGATTDGFFSAYGVFVVVVLAAGAIRVTVMPAFARAREELRLGGEVAAHAVALGLVAVPAVVLSVVLAGPLAGLLTGGESPVARHVAEAALPWMLVASLCQLYAGLAASVLAALDSYGVAAAGFGAGSIAGLALILWRVDTDGVQSFAWGMAVNGAVALTVPVLALLWRARRERLGARSLHPSGRLAPRLGSMATGIAQPLAMQLVYVVCLPLAAHEGEGAATTLSYAFLVSSAVVAVTGSSLGLVTTVPLARVGVHALTAARHVVASSWVSVLCIGAAAGVFGIAGERILGAILGSSYGSRAGGQLGTLVVALTPWAIASVGLTVSFPLLFVVGRVRWLPVIAAGALGLQVPLAWAAGRLFGLDGLALSLGVVATAVLAAQLVLLRSLRVTARGLVVPVAVASSSAAVAFVPLGAVLPQLAAATVGLAVYVVIVVLWRPPGLVSAWRYLRALA